jgi:hypothetical protein
LIKSHLRFSQIKKHYKLVAKKTYALYYKGCSKDNFQSIILPDCSFFNISCSMRRRVFSRLNRCNSSSSGLKRPLPRKVSILSGLLRLTQFRSKLPLTQSSRDNSEIRLPSSTIKRTDSFLNYFVYFLHFLLIKTPPKGIINTTFFVPTFSWKDQYSLAVEHGHAEASCESPRHGLREESLIHFCQKPITPSFHRIHPNRPRITEKSMNRK